MVPCQENFHKVAVKMQILGGPWGLGVRGTQSQGSVYEFAPVTCELKHRGTKVYADVPVLFLAGLFVLVVSVSFVSGGIRAAEGAFCPRPTARIRESHPEECAEKPSILCEAYLNDVQIMRAILQTCKSLKHGEARPRTCKAYLRTQRPKGRFWLRMQKRSFRVQGSLIVLIYLD